MESTFVKTTESYTVARKNTTTEIHEVMQYQEYSGMYMPTAEMKHATSFDSQEKAKELANMLNMFAKFQNSTYEYYVLKQNVVVTEVEFSV